MNRETKRMMQRQGQMEADGSPSTRRAPAGAATRTPPKQKGGAPKRRRSTPAQFVREVRDEMRQVAWPSRAELINYTSVVFTTLVIMIGLIFVLNLAFGKLVTDLFTK
ncbi:MAG TPA: preprotein translocase subunit SecE [Acidimicrobiales bacterium]|nr:preprotein translocase subunit SecE [Acidimicrobiales bacterium]